MIIDLNSVFSLIFSVFQILKNYMNLKMVFSFETHDGTYYVFSWWLLLIVSFIIGTIALIFFGSDDDDL